MTVVIVGARARRRYGPRQYDLMWRRILERALYPQRCLLCGETATEIYLCCSCQHALPRLGACCPRCASALPLSLLEKRAGEIGAPCRLCGRDAGPIDGIAVPYRYAFPIDRMLLKLKYHGDQSLGRILGHLLADFLLQRDAGRPDIIIPVPLHRTRLRQRGFNQSLEIAAPVSRRLGLRCAPHACRRVLPTESQTSLNTRQRRRNLRRAFCIDRDVEGCHVALVDDVMTTGATANELARSFKSAGATRVDLWCVARAMIRIER